MAYHLDYFQKTVRDDWCCKQTYIALGDMMSGATMIGIDSCPIEGFHYASVNMAEESLFDPNEWGELAW